MNKLEKKELIKTLSLERIRNISETIKRQKEANSFNIKRNNLLSGPLSFSQQRVMFLSQISPLYHAPSFTHIKSQFEFDIELLETSFNKIIERHEILRTIFDLNNNKQIVLTNKTIKLKYINLQNSIAQYDDAKKIAEAENSIPFELNKWPLIRFTVLQLDKQEYVFIVILHHIISDGWSYTMIFQELKKIYSILAKGDSVNLPQNRFEYLDYVMWEKLSLETDNNFSRMLDYWKNKLKGNIIPIRLPTDYKREVKPSYICNSEFIKIDQNTTESLKKLCKIYNVTLFEFTLTAFFLLIHTYTEQNDLIIGTSVANRDLEYSQNMLGLFTNTALYRLTIEDDKTNTIELLRQVSQINREALYNQSIPFDLIIKELNPERIYGQTPLISCFFSYRNFPKMFEYSEIKALPFKVDTNISYFELELTIEEVDGLLYCTMGYRNELFDSKTIKNMLSFYKDLIIKLYENINYPISLILGENYDKPYPVIKNATTNFINLFENQVKINPNKIALEYKSLNITYEELNSTANKVAHYLKKIGVTIGDCIGLISECSLSTIIGMFGILKCGSTYIPISKDTPSERIKYIIKDTRISVVLTTNDYKIHGITNVYINHKCEYIKNESEDNLNLDIKCNNLAYIIYTSGSTGKPNAVCIEQKQLSSYIKAIWKDMSIPEDARFAMLTPLSTDIGNTMIFAPLSYGSKVLIIPDELVFNPYQLSKLFIEKPVDCLKLTPTHIKTFLYSGYIKNLLPKHLLVLAREKLDPKIIKKIRQYSNCRISNYYEQTETTTTALTYKVPENLNNTISIPIGYPIGNSITYVLNKNMLQVPQGAAGELYIGGTGISRGYLNNDEFTSQKFFIKKGQRLYKTGDLVRIRSDDSIEFIAKLDHKIKTFESELRIEEVEAALIENEKIENLAVILIDKKIFAYVSSQDALLTPDELKEFLRTKLPFYMIPTKIFILDKIPLTNHGKLNYNALPYYLLHSEESLQKIYPRDEIELELTKIWESILKVEPMSISINDNFFELGGHSILIMQLMRIIEQRFKKRITLDILFEFNTIERLANVIKTGIKFVYSPVITFTYPKKPEVQIFFIHPSGGNIFCYYELAKHLDKNYQIHAIQFPFAENHNFSLASSINEMADYYVKKCLENIEIKTNVLFGGWSIGGAIAFEMANKFYKINNNLPLVTIIDYAVPITVVDKASVKNNKDSIVNFIKKIEIFSGIKSEILNSELTTMSIKQLSTLVLDYFKKINIVPSGLKIKDFQKFLKVQIMHNIASDNYIPSNYPGETLIIKAQDQIFHEQKYIDTCLGWSKYTIKNPEIKIVTGNHITIMSTNNIKMVAENIDNWIKSKLGSNGIDPTCVQNL